MLAVIEQAQSGYTARFERRLAHPAEQVWPYLTENERLRQWFSQLKVEDARSANRLG